ncbi:hypothetical protein PZH33_21535, partial [Blautia schinkii]|nr:hypothetical protein [Blautia schinkii]
MQKRLAGQIAADKNNAQKILKQNPSLLRKLNSHFDLPEMEPQDILTALCQKKLVKIFRLCQRQTTPYAMYI